MRVNFASVRQIRIHKNPYLIHLDSALLNDTKHSITHGNNAKEEVDKMMCWPNRSMVMVSGPHTRLSYFPLCRVIPKPGRVAFFCLEMSCSSPKKHNRLGRREERNLSSMLGSCACLWPLTLARQVFTKGLRTSTI